MLISRRKWRRMYADIIVDITNGQLDKTFQYKVPKELEGSLETGMLVKIPFGAANRIITGYVIELGYEPKFNPDRIKYIDSIAADRVYMVERMIQLAAWLKHNYGGTMNQALKTVLPVKDKIRQKEKKSIRLLVEREEAVRLAEEFEKKHAVAKARLVSALADSPVISCDTVKSKLNISQSTIKSLTDSNIICVDVDEIYRNPIKSICNEKESYSLNSEQQKIIDEFCFDYKNNNLCKYLIHGITGSGKTLCYIEMIEYVVNSGKQVIMLIPEIALTFQTVQRFYARFGERVSIINSRMSKGERYDQFLRAMRGEISIIIGPRSALFTPFSNIGLIVIDEEHESAYKSEVTPKYNATETAAYIAQQHSASLVLGSATPSVDSYYKALNGEYKLFTLTKRATGGELPVIHTVDLREELKNGNRSIFSNKLQSLIADRLSKNEQIMLFLNKRGYAGFISCRSCGCVIKCPHCDISLTVHKNGKMICHYCGYEQKNISLCPKCGSRYISGFRAGTQQVEESVKKYFPQARVLRMDMDTTSGKDGHEKILSSFAKREADILVGTQMIVKGHDFSNVTLVGVLAADMSLYVSDYRASERTFQLLVQAAGRAGRGKESGEVVIQTYTPDNYSIQAAGNHDYHAFYREEIAFREFMEYPPVSNMLKISIMAKNEEYLQKICGLLKKVLIDLKGDILCQEKMSVTGPVEAAVYKLNDIYTQYVYVKANHYETLTQYKDILENYIRNHTEFNQTMIQYDFNP